MGRNGGPRPGAGRPRGVKNRTSRKTYEKLEARGAKLPLDYMLEVMADPNVDVNRRDKMAVAAAPYVHNRLSSVIVKNDPNKPFTLITATMTPKEAAAAYAQMIKETGN